MYKNKLLKTISFLLLFEYYKSFTINNIFDRLVII